MNTNDEFRPWGMDVNQFSMFMHLAQFAGIIIPFAGLVLPIVMWLTNKDESEIVDMHGKNILNWMISCVIYGFAGFILVFFLIGIPVLVALGICNLIFIIIGAVKANEGVVYKYPLAINFLN